jgi:hypothetical protein
MWLRFTFDNLRQAAYPPLTLVIFEDCVICLHVIEDHQLNDQLHITPNSSKWQLPLYV